jgi:hypothetical protein
MKYAIIAFFILTATLVITCNTGLLRMFTDWFFS